MMATPPNTPPNMPQVSEQSIWIDADVAAVERCLTDLDLMHRWLNPWLRCEPVGVWGTDLGCQSRFVIQIPLLKPTLSNVVVERQPGLIVWEFEGFFRGRDRWECQPAGAGTWLRNRFEFVIPNAIVALGFHLLASRLMRHDMQAQLQRLRQVAETIGPI